MFKKTIVIFLLLSILMSVACNTPSDPSEPPESTPSASTSESEVGTPDESTPPPSFAPEAQTKSEYDTNEVYKHVFEDHSTRIDFSDLENTDVDPDKGEGIVMILIGPADKTEEAEYYVVNGLTTKTSNNCDKYFMTPNRMSQSGGGGTVTDDYHEAYLDVMFENLTFTKCEGIPQLEDGAYEMAKISLDGKIYYVLSDGYLYHTEKNADAELSYRSEQKIDAPYLYVIALMSHLNRARISGEGKQIILINEEAEVAEDCETRTVKRGENTFTFLVSKDGTAYDVADGAAWTADPHYLGYSKGSIGIYSKRSVIYIDAEDQNIFLEY